jgi:hypothetical protein
VQKSTNVLFAGFLLIMSGCATLSESQCAANDWQTIGYRDGINGTAAAQLLKHQNACVKHGVIPDRDAYLAGWHQGVEQYCQAENGFTVGQRGGSYTSICPDYLQAAFHSAYQDGRRLYLARMEIGQLERQISKREKRLQELRSELSAVEAALIAAETSTEDRVVLLSQTKALAQEQGQLEAEVQDLNVEVALKTDQLSSLRNTLASAAY